jgi:hypothetical protein
MNRLTVHIICAAYGISPATVATWRKKAGLSIDDFRDPSLVGRRLLAVAKNNSPRLQCITAPKFQAETCFRLSVRGITPIS